MCATASPPTSNKSLGPWAWTRASGLSFSAPCAALAFGGSCLPKDIRGFIWWAERVGVDFSLLKEVERINKSCVPRLLEKARKALWVLKEKQIGILGLAYKANTDDIRFAPALDFIQILLAEEARVRA